MTKKLFDLRDARNGPQGLWNLNQALIASAPQPPAVDLPIRTLNIIGHVDMKLIFSINVNWFEINEW